ncbi:hypothetical protein PHMEG_00020777 [Phytophthora megakarya]|uniref:Uncharacterized protein n=1 Tax=Phytophthora megakarya TaxID=4795 RepID=A0A225VP71_9STRA|nr:hypothetical protein PHMEG_00020777 [Phytophthora megakarya]
MTGLQRDVLTPNREADFQLHSTFDEHFTEHSISQFPMNVSCGGYAHGLLLSVKKIGIFI